MICFFLRLLLALLLTFIDKVQGYLFVISKPAAGSSGLLRSIITTTSSNAAKASTTTAMYSSNNLYDYQSKENPKSLIVKGMQAFQQGKIEESIQYFDQADALVPNDKLSPFLWQRGISLYYADAFQEASHQFQLDVKVNPLDVEEIVWDIASQNRLHQFQQDSNKELSSSSSSSSHYLSLPPGKSDRRKIMSVIYSLFRNENNVQEQDLFMAGINGSISDEFYSLFYLGLYCESIGETSKASYYMRSATRTEYAKGKGASDYMTSCARVHCQLRHWV